MEVNIYSSPKELGKEAAAFCCRILKKAIDDNGVARIILSTGASQFDTIESLVESDIDWSKVEMFHLDEYVSLPEEHPASFRKYLKERFVNRITLKSTHYVNGEGDLLDNIDKLTQELDKMPIDLALIGIGENAHIAFNDPPADFETKEAYIVVDLDEACKKQQVREGWFASIEDVPKQAISMTVHRIMQSRVIVSCVPYSVKADAIQAMFSNDVTNRVPATILKTHPNFHLFLDGTSASKLNREKITG